MKNLIVSLILFVLLSGLQSDRIAAQEDSNLRRRAMFVTKKADGLEIKILKQTDKVFALVSPGYEFKSGDCIRISFLSNFDGHVYFVNVAPNSDTRVIHHALVKAEKENELPAAPNVIRFDDEVGVEILKIVMSRDSIPVFDDALKTAEGMLGKTATSVAKELGSRSLPPKSEPKGEAVGIVQPNNNEGTRCRGLFFPGGEKTRCRGLAVDTGNPQKNQGTVAVAIPDDPNDKNADGKLKSGDVVVVELQLKHTK